MSITAKSEGVQLSPTYYYGLEGFVMECHASHPTQTAQRVVSIAELVLRSAWPLRPDTCKVQCCNHPLLPLVAVVGVSMRALHPQAEPLSDARVISGRFSFSS